MSDDDIASCADIETGIYGVTTSCEGRAACPDSDQGVCDSFGVIAVPPGVMITPGTVYDDAGTVASAHDGRYALSLSPGDYYVCCPSHGQVTSQTCAIAHVETGKKVRIDAKLVATGGGVSCTTTAR
ncbi:MAG: hypothetical protein ACRELY_02335 [Polyangiaceae bacterium]